MLSSQGNSHLSTKAIQSQINCIERNAGSNKFLLHGFIPVTSDYDANPTIQALSQEIRGEIGRLDNEVLLQLEEGGLNGEFKCIRNGETELGSFLCDIARAYVSDATGVHIQGLLINSGTFRIDSVINNKLTLKNLIDLLPYEDPLQILLISGQDLFNTVQNGISRYT